MVDASIVFLGVKISFPLIISCMTGGSEEGFKVNVDLAKAAEELKIPVGMGSYRILLEKPQLSPHFELKKYAPSAPVIGNIGLIQLRDEDKKSILKIAGDLGCDALAVHVNPGQEIFQPEGDKDFRGLKDNLAEFIAMAKLPIIVKETGCGFDPESVNFFVKCGASYVDLAGAGGTNWISVERERQRGYKAAAAAEFAEWGIPTAVSLYLDKGRSPLIASGGIRTVMDAAKSIGMGAVCAAMARAFIIAVKEKGKEGAIELAKSVKTVIESAMALNGCLNIEEFRKIKLVYGEKFLAAASAYAEAFGNDTAC